MKKHTGGCHCGKVRYEVDLDLSAPVISCNCSMCGRSGALLQFVPASQFTLVKGEDAQTDYLFNTKGIHHLFCSSCGIKSFAHAIGPKGPMVAINTRCLDDVDVSKLTVHPIDGKNL
jgi:hypothetical protein